MRDRKWYSMVIIHFTDFNNLNILDTTVKTLAAIMIFQDFVV